MRASAARRKLSGPLSSKPQSRQVGLGNESASGAPRWGLCLAPLGFWLREEARPVGPRPSASVAPASPHGVESRFTPRLARRLLQAGMEHGRGRLDALDQMRVQAGKKEVRS